MTLPQWILPVLMAAATPVAGTPAKTTPAATSPPPVKLEFPLAGYRINAYDLSSFRMALPVPGKSSWFSVAVYYSDTIAAKPSGQNHPGSHLRSGETLLFERTLSPTESQVEYTFQGDKPEEKTHVYIRKIVANGKTYEISGGLPDTDWSADGAKLREYVDNFEPSPNPAPGKTVFPRQVYRISLPDGVLPANAQGTLLGFGPSVPTVIVSVEPYAKTLKEYRAERKPPFMTDPKHKPIILAESTPAENALVTEYGEEVPADKNHQQFQGPTCYEKVVLAQGHLYRAWGILVFQSERKSFPLIKTSVESLEAIPTPAPAK